MPIAQAAQGDRLPMKQKELPVVLDVAALRARYDEAIAEINATRDNRLTAAFYAKTGDAVFNAGLDALADWRTGNRRMLTVSAPAGGGKTSFSYALMMAVTRNAESNPEAPYGCVFVVDQISKADEVYREVSALLSDKVAIWTTDHDVNCKKPTKIKKPAAKLRAKSCAFTPSLWSRTNSILDPRDAMRATSPAINTCAHAL
jgi:hypothetical protein